MKENEYQYPDPEDRMTAQNIRRIELYPGYWKESEKNVLNIVKKIIGPGTGQRRFLDAGCGEGRLIPFFADQFNEIVAIDPDQERLRVAVELVCDLGLSRKTQIKQVAIEDFEDNNKFDFILCSHVLQHVHTASVPVIIKKLRNLVKEDGLLCITTCHSTKNEGYFVKNFLKKSQHLSEAITKDEFNLLINSGESLPVHFFQSNELDKLLSSNELKVIEFRVFHLETGLQGVKNNEKMDEAANSNSDLQKMFGWDMMIAAKPIF